MNYADRHIHDLPIIHSLIFCTLCSGVTEMNIYVAIWRQWVMLFENGLIFIHSIHSFIHSFILLSDLWQNYILYQSEFAIQCDSASFPFNFHYPLFSLRPSSSCCLLPLSPIISILPTIFLLITCFRKQFLCKMWPIQLASLFFKICTLYSSPLWLYVILLHFSHGQSSRSLSFSSTTFQNFSHISDLFSEASKFQHRKKLCSRCSNLLVSSLN